MADESSKRGTKRTRHEAPKEKDIGMRIAGKMHHDLKDVRKAAKKAKTFEMQKLVKKLKGLRRNNGGVHEIHDLETQLQAMKDTNHVEMANVASKTRLNKDRILSKNEHVQAAIFDELGSNPFVHAVVGTPAAKVQNRLLSSKILATKVAVAVEDLRSMLRLEIDITGEDGDNYVDEEFAERPKKKTKVQEMEMGKRNIALGDESGEADVNEDDSENAEDQGEADEAGWESGTVDDNEKEPDDGWESGSLPQELIGSLEEKNDIDLIPPESGSEDAEDDDLAQSSTIKQLNPAAAPQAKAKKSVLESMFLPSLAVGYVRGGSDESWSDSEAKIADNNQKKNRRGQRARRAIWEKKFGKNANHKKKEAEVIRARGYQASLRRPDTANRSRNHSLSNSGGRQDGSSALPQHQFSTGPGLVPGPRSSSISQGVLAANPKLAVHKIGHREERPLHPSWEAKKRLKEKESARILPSQGTKIKFS